MGSSAHIELGRKVSIGFNAPVSLPDLRPQTMHVTLRGRSGGGRRDRVSSPGSGIWRHRQAWRECCAEAPRCVAWCHARAWLNREGDVEMNKTLIASTIRAGVWREFRGWANPTNTNSGDPDSSLAQSATATSTQSGNRGPAANENSHRQGHNQQQQRQQQQQRPGQRQELEQHVRRLQGLPVTAVLRRTTAPRRTPGRTRSTPCSRAVAFARHGEQHRVSGLGNNAWKRGQCDRRTGRVTDRAARG